MFVLHTVDCGKVLREGQTICTFCAHAKRCANCRRDMRLKQFEHTPGTNICRRCQNRLDEEHFQTGGNSTSPPTRSPFNIRVINVDDIEHSDPLVYMSIASDKLHDSLEEKLSDMRYATFHLYIQTFN